MEREENGGKVSWKTVHGVRNGVILARFYRKKDNALLGYIVQMEDRKKMIVHPKSFINAETSEQKPR